MKKVEKPAELHTFSVMTVEELKSSNQLAGLADRPAQY